MLLSNKDMVHCQYKKVENVIITQNPTLHGYFFHLLLWLTFEVKHKLLEVLLVTDSRISVQSTPNCIVSKK